MRDAKKIDSYLIKTNLKRGFYETFLAATVIIAFFPFFWAFILSLKSNADIARGDLSLPVVPAWENYIKAWNMIDIPLMIRNTLFIAVISMSICVVISIFGAFALSRIKFGTGLLQRVYYLYFIVGLIIPAHVMLYPVYKMNALFGTLDSLWGVILPYIGWNVPMNMLLLVGAFKAVPDSVEESAVIDGCNPFKLLLRVDMPMIKAAIGTVLIVNFLAVWNEFAVSVIMLSSPSNQTISLATSKFVGQFLVDYASMAAAVIMLVIPQVLAFSFFQRFIVADLTAGAEKG